MKTVKRVPHGPIAELENTFSGTGHLNLTAFARLVRREHIAKRQMLRRASPTSNLSALPEPCRFRLLPRIDPDRYALLVVLDRIAQAGRLQPPSVRLAHGIMTMPPRRLASRKQHAPLGNTSMMRGRRHTIESANHALNLTLPQRKTLRSAHPGRTALRGSIK